MWWAWGFIECIYLQRPPCVKDLMQAASCFADSAGAVSPSRRPPGSPRAQGFAMADMVTWLMHAQKLHDPQNICVAGTINTPPCSGNQLDMGP